MHVNLDKKYSFYTVATLAYVYPMKYILICLKTKNVDIINREIALSYKEKEPILPFSFEHKVHRNSLTLMVPVLSSPSFQQQPEGFVIAVSIVVLVDSKWVTLSP